ncbi:hypothetical protein [Mycolicibacterium sp. XJ870]
MKTTSMAFEEIVASFDDTLRCRGHRPCRRPARWLIVFHDCGEWPVCTQCRNLWRHDVELDSELDVLDFGDIWCGCCYRRFKTVEAYTKARPL